MVRQAVDHRMSSTMAVMVAMVLISHSANGADVESSRIAEFGYNLLKQHCGRCHSQELAVPGLDVLNRDTLVDGQYIDLNDPEKSTLWQRVAVDQDMPPDGEPKLADIELAVLKDWLDEGAPFPSIDRREIVSELQVYAMIRDRLQQTELVDRKYMRFFSLVNMNNNWENVTNDEYRIYKAAFSKAVNSLSWQRRIVPPVAIDPTQTIFMVDLRDYGWDEKHLWRKILQSYPYALRHDESDSELLRRAFTDVRSLTGTEVPVLRVDWFVNYATRPPLYHELLQLPKTAQELEQILDVDSKRDFFADRLLRAGFATSGVSGQNRLVDRHASNFGMYWKSFDFRSSTARGNIFQFPLGPAFHENPFPQQAFEHDGGEMIFTLPNGLQGYFLTDGVGNRIDAGPEDVVSDRLKTSGTSAIVNGLSCIACHKNGVVRFQDTVRNGIGVFGTARNKAFSLFPTAESLERALDKDEAIFVEALEQAILPMIDDAGVKDMRSYPEPIGAIARRYQQDLGIGEVAAELGVSRDEIKAAVRLNPSLIRLGLGPLANDQKIKRETWESLKQTLSAYQLTATALKLGTPLRIF